MAKKLTFKAVRVVVRDLGYTISPKSQWGEYRLNAQHGTEESAYYTDDLGDAFRTALFDAERMRPDTATVTDIIPGVF